MSKNHRHVSKILGLLAVLSAGNAYGQTVLAGWDFSGLSAYGASPLAPTTTAAAGVDVVGLTRGSGFTTSGSAATNGWGGNGLDAASEAAAITASDFATFSLTVEEGYTVSFGSLSAYNVRRSGTGATSGQWQYQIGSGGFSDIGSDITWGGTTTATGNAQGAIDLSGIEALQSLAAGTEVTFRLVVWGASASGGNWYLNNYQVGDDFSVLGTIGLAGAANISIGNGMGFSPNSFGGAAFTAVDSAVFDGEPGTVTLSGEVVATNLKFDVTGYTLASAGAGDTIEVTGAVETAAGVEATISGKVTGDNGLSKAGAGTLNLTNADNDFTGNVNIAAGVLRVSSDGALGDSENDIVLAGGTLGSIGSLALSAGRNISGSGGIAVAEGDTLSVAGDVTTTALTLRDKGTLALNGSLNTLGALTFAEAGVLTGQVITVSSVTTTHSTGTARIENEVALASGDRAFSIAGDLDLDGALSGEGRIVKTGAGTLTVGGGTNSFTGGFRIGVQGATPGEGGRVVVSESGDLGGFQLQFNSGTLEATQAVAFANGVSIGGRNNNGVSSPTFDGADMSFAGGNSFFRATGTTGQLAFKVNNTTTMTGTWAATSGSGSATGITLGGTGRFVIEGDASAVTDTWTLADTVTLRLNNTLGGGVNVANGTTLEGVGTTLGLVTVGSGGVISPGNSIGQFNADGGITFLSGAKASFELGEDGVSSDHIATTIFTFDPTSGVIVFDFNGTGVVGGVYDLMSFTSLEGGLAEGDSTPFSYINLKEGLFGTFTLTGTGLGFSISVVPEPSAAAAIAGSLVLAGVALRRRRVRAVHGTC